MILIFRLVEVPRLLLGCLLISLSALVGAQNYHQYAEGINFISMLQNEYGFAPEQVSRWLALAQKRQSILDAISRPAERVKPWYEYRAIFMNEKRINAGVKFWREHQSILEEAERKYGVPAQIIVAIIGVETLYGANTGNYLVLDALTTLGFDYPPRADFFRSELTQFFLLAREQQIDISQVKGSYAGAMGLSQFISSSWRNFAVDFDGDGKIDLWQAADAIGSIANYFKQHGWHTNGRIAIKAKVSGQEFKQVLSTKLEASVTGQELRAAGWYGFSDAFNDYQITAMELEGKDGFEYWLGLPNFYVITRYNRSKMYAMAVYQLSEAIAASFYDENSK